MAPLAQDRKGRGVMEVDWPFFGELCRGLALKVWRDYEPDLVVGIARAGVIPGAVIAIQTFGDFLGFNPHCHELMTEDPLYFSKHERTGRPLGSKRFIGQLEAKLGRVLKPQKGGRPKKQKN